VYSFNSKGTHFDLTSGSYIKPSNQIVSQFSCTQYTVWTAQRLHWLGLFFFQYKDRFPTQFEVPFTHVNSHVTLWALLIHCWLKFNLVMIFQQMPPTKYKLKSLKSQWPKRSKWG